MIELVLDGKWPDGDAADDEARDDAIAWCAEHEPELHRLFTIARHGVTPEGESVEWGERSKALDKLERRRRGPVDQPIAQARVDIIEELGGSPRRDDQRLVEGAYGHERKTSASATASTARAVRVESADGTDWQNLGNDTDAIRVLLEVLAEDAGATLTELARPFKRGTLTKAERKRYDQLARLVAAARERGARLEAIGTVLGRPRARVADLEKRAGRLAVISS